MNDGAVLWRHRWLGVRPIELDRTRSIAFVPGAVPPAAQSGAAATDVILLANGDRVEGIVESLGSVVKVAPTGGAAVEVPLERIAAMSLITPLVGSTAPRIWLVDGTVVDALPELAAADQGVTVRLGAALPRATSPEGTEAGATGAPAPDREAPEATRLDVEAILGFAPDPSRFVPLGSLEPSAVRTSGNLPRFAVPKPERAPGAWAGDAGPVVIRGPIVVDYSLPQADCAFVASIAPAEPDERWTDCEVVIRDGSRELARLPIEARTAPQWVHFEHLSTSLTIEVTEGARGPVRDAIRLSEALVIRPSAKR